MSKKHLIAFIWHAGLGAAAGMFLAWLYTIYRNPYNVNLGIYIFVLMLFASVWGGVIGLIIGISSMAIGRKFSLLARAIIGGCIVLAVAWLFGWMALGNLRSVNDEPISLTWALIDRGMIIVLFGVLPGIASGIAKFSAARIKTRI